MTPISLLPSSILKRNEFENKRSYDNAMWLLEKMNHLVKLHNIGYIIFQNGNKFIPDLKVSYYPPEDGLEYCDDDTVDKSGQVYHIGFGPTGLIGMTRSNDKGLIWVSKNEAKQYLKTITFVHQSDIHNLLDI